MANSFWNMTEQSLESKYLNWNNDLNGADQSKTDRIKTVGWSEHQQYSCQSANKFFRWLCKNGIWTWRRILQNEYRNLTPKVDTTKTVKLIWGKKKSIDWILCKWVVYERYDVLTFIDGTMTIFTALLGLYRHSWITNFGLLLMEFLYNFISVFYCEMSRKYTIAKTV